MFLFQFLLLHLIFPRGAFIARPNSPLSGNVESGRSQFLVLMSKYRRLSTYRQEIFVTTAQAVKFSVILN